MAKGAAPGRGQKMVGRLMKIEQGRYLLGNAAGFACLILVKSTGLDEIIGKL
jgi:hypothetical protein